VHHAKIIQLLIGFISFSRESYRGVGMKSLGAIMPYLLCWPIFFAGLLPTQNAKALEAAIKLGTVDLRNLQSDETLSLRGDWHFFWNELISPSELVMRLQAPDYQAKFATIGQRFQDLRSDGGTDDIGFASYALKLDNLPNTMLSLASLSTYNGARLFIFQAAEVADIQPLVSIGVVGTNKENSEPAISMDGLVNFTPVANQSYYLLIQVSNFHFNWGGMWTPPSIGSHQAVAKLLAGNQRTTYLTIGMFLILFLYNSSFYLRRKEDKASLYLALFCFVIIIRSFVLINWSLDIFSNFERSFALNIRSIFLTQPGIVLTFMLFMRACFPKQTSVWIPRLFVAIYALPSLMVLLTPPLIHGQLSNFFKFMGILSMPILIISALRALMAREEGSLASLLGSLFFLVGALLDIGSTLNWWTSPGNMTGIGLVCFGCFQSQIVAIRFATAFRKSEHLSRALGEEVDRQTRDIKSILKNIRQGIFTLVPPFKKVGEQYSDHLLTLLGKSNVTGMTLDQLLLKQSDLTGDSKNQIQAVLDASIGESSLAFEVNESNLAKELSFQRLDDQSTHILEIDWNPIVNKNDEVEKILVSLRDVTEIRKLKFEAGQREEDMRILIELIQIPEEKFQRFLTTTKEYITENRELINDNKGTHAEHIKRLFMNMHTIKGAARTYSLKAISAAAHEVEQYYASLQKKEQDWDHEKLILDLDEIHKILTHYQDVGEERLGWSAKKRIVKIEKTQLEDNLKFLLSMNSRGLSAEHLQHFWALAQRLSALCYEPLSLFISEAARGLDSIARDLHKEVPVTMFPETSILMTEAGGTFVHSILVHLFRNSMDHGIETAELRLQRGKSPQGTITISCSLQNSGLAFSFRDDGNGLDLLAIETKGRERGFIQAGQHYSDIEIASLIFQSGFSTKNAVSEISGRGVGLDAVRTFSKAAGAPISIKLDEIHDRQRVGFSFELVIPPNLFWQSDPVPNSLQVAS